MTAKVGSIVSLYYDSPTRVQFGEFLRTPTMRTYRIVSVRIQERGKHVGRQHIMAEVVEPFEADFDDVVHAIHWYPRPRKGVKLTRRGHQLVIAVMLIGGFTFGLLFPYVLIPS